MKTRHRVCCVPIALMLAVGPSTTIAQAPAAKAPAAKAPAASAHAMSVDMAEVRRLAREPVETILSGAPIGRISDVDYWSTVQGSPKPVIVVFYANQEEQSRHLATLVRYIAMEFSGSIAFYAYRVTAGATAEHSALAAIDRRYKVKHVPATLFYDNDRGKMELEKTEYSAPA